MPKLPQLSGEQACRILERHGFSRVRQRGSHIIMQRRTENSTITVPVPNHKELRLGTLLSIIRQSQLPRSAGGIALRIPQLEWAGLVLGYFRAPLAELARAGSAQCAPSPPFSIGEQNASGKAGGTPGLQSGASGPAWLRLSFGKMSDVTLEYQIDRS